MANLASIICNNAPRAFYVGGVLRDGVLGRYSGDIDLALARAAVRPAALALARALGGAAFEMDADFCVWRVTCKDGLQIDLSALVGPEEPRPSLRGAAGDAAIQSLQSLIKQDLARRDFTINALACPVAALPSIRTKKAGAKKLVLLRAAAKDIIDLHGGLKDIKAQKIRATTPKVFKEDPLRLLRAVRAAAELGFTIAPATKALIKKHSALITRPAGERVQEELRRIFAQPRTKYFLKQMDELGLLTKFLPELQKQKNCAKVYYGAGGVFAHTLDVVDRVELLLKNLKKIYPGFYKNLQPFVADISLYKMAALLHDIAKPKTAKIIDGRLRFFHHEEEGAKMAEEVLRNLKYSAADIKLICKMIAHHLRPSNLASNEIITDRGVYNFFKELGPATVPMLLLCWADYASYITPAKALALAAPARRPVMTLEAGKKRGATGKTLRHMQVLNFLLGKYFNEAAKLVLPKRFIDGKDVIALLKIKPGPQIGAALEAVTIAQVEGKVKDRQQALAWLLAKRKDFI